MMIIVPLQDGLMMVRQGSMSGVWWMPWSIYTDEETNQYKPFSNLFNNLFIYEMATGEAYRALGCRVMSCSAHSFLEEYIYGL